MSSENSRQKDNVWWILILALFVGAIGGSYYFSSHSLLLRVVGLLVCAAIAIAMTLKTNFGLKIWTQWLEVVQEVRRIHWPTRQETLQTTAAVLAMVVAMGILLWTADFALLKVVKWLTGYWGV
jgi:preprotein translocase subunit SecE